MFEDGNKHFMKETEPGSNLDPSNKVLANNEADTCENTSKKYTEDHVLFGSDGF